MKFQQKTLKIAVATAGLCILVPAAFGQGIGLREFRSLHTPTPQKIERGEKVWKQNCASCHGPDGAGEGPQAASLDPAPPNLKEGEYRWGGGRVEVYNVISKGQNGHPIFEHVPYQDLWAVTHFTRSLGPTDDLKDPPEVLAQAEFEAKEGVCDESVKKSISDKMEFKGDAQIAQGKAIYATNCSSCHGPEGNGDGPAAAALDPPPRDFHAPADQWTEGTSPLAIFDVLQNGVEGTAMASFAHVGEADLWAITHLIREEWLPEGAKQEVTEEQLTTVCRSLSGGGEVASIPIEAAMKFFAESVEEERSLRVARYGTAWVDDDARAGQGKDIYEAHCQSCHGPNGRGAQLGPYGASPPYFYVDVNALVPGFAGGSYEDFAQRSIGGAHMVIGEMTGVSHIGNDDWRALHAYVTSFEGDGEVKLASTRPEPTAEETAEETAGETGEEALEEPGTDAEATGTSDEESDQEGDTTDEPSAEPEPEEANETGEAEPAAEQESPPAEEAAEE